MARAYSTVVVLVSLGAIFTEKFADQNCQSRKTVLFVWQNLGLWKLFFHFFPRPSSWPVRAVRFGPPNFDWGHKTRISNDNSWSKMIIYRSKVYVRFCTTPARLNWAWALHKFRHIWFVLLLLQVVCSERWIVCYKRKHLKLDEYKTGFTTLRNES